eukprot:GHVQ01016848.1.p1 GENE.GHVQ01016848.1~~GHVQ01016848.1.p1  ORF type:complete len:107 (+),score=5.70 GHVQ01016848.1:279-599(+)
MSQLEGDGGSNSVESASGEKIELVSEVCRSDQRSLFTLETLYEWANSLQVSNQLILSVLRSHHSVAGWHHLVVYTCCFGISSDSSCEGIASSISTVRTCVRNAVAY